MMAQPPIHFWRPCKVETFPLAGVWPMGEGIFSGTNVILRRQGKLLVQLIRDFLKGLLRYLDRADMAPGRQAMIHDNHELVK
jgi:hypothetical protein